MSRFVRLYAVMFAVIFGVSVFGASWWPSQAKVAPSRRPQLNAVPGSPSISITTLGTPITQNFDTLLTTGTANPWTDDSTLPGWYAQFSATPANPTTYRADSGGSNTGAIYSWGVAGVNPLTDRALGSVSSGTPVTVYFALKLTNNTGSPIGSIDVSYTGEQWRDGGAAVPAAQTTNFQYQIAAAGTITDANTPTTGWTTFPTLSFTSPTFTNTGAGVALDGNAAANRTAKSATITFGTPVSVGQEIWIRWEDINDTGNDHGLAVDDLSVTPNGVSGPLQYRSAAIGNWNANATWESSPDGSTWTAATSTPTSASDVITVRAGHIVTVSADVDADQFTIAPGGTVLINSGVTLTIADGAGTDATISGSLATAGTVTNNGQVLVNNTLQINQGGSLASGTGTYTYDPTATLTFNNSSGSFVVGNVIFWPSSNGPLRISVTGAGGITMSVARTITNLTTASGISGAANLTINGVFQLNAGGFVSGSPTYGPASSLTYATGGSYGRAGEWLPGVASQPGYPNNVTITSNTTLDLPNSSSGSTFQMSGILNIQPGSTLQMAGSTPLTQALTVLGDVSNFGTISLSTAAGGDLKLQGGYFEGTTGSLTGNAGVLRFEGGAIQQISDLTGSMTLSKTVINKTANFVRLSNTDVTINDAAGGDSVTFANATSQLDINGRTLTLGGLLPAPPAGAGLIGSQTSNLVLNDGGAAGNMGTVRFVFPQSLNNFTVNRTTAAGNVTLGNPVAIYGTLTLTAGTITAGGNVVEVVPGATMSRTSGYVIGPVQKDFSATGSFTFPVGTATGYSPVDATVTAGSGSLLVRPIASAEPSLNASHSAGRYWILNGTGITTNLIFHYLDGDVNGSEAVYRLIRVSSGTAITFNNLCPAAPCVDTAANTATINNVNHFSDWTVGEPFAPTAAPAELSGHVFAGPGGRPFRNIEVRLQNLSTGEVTVTRTDAKGRYSFPTVDTGVDYLVTPVKPGYNFGPASQLITHSGAITTVDFTATPDPALVPTKPTGPAPPVKTDHPKQ
jgi:hypothetical protein